MKSWSILVGKKDNESLNLIYSCSALLISCCNGKFYNIKAKSSFKYCIYLWLGLKLLYSYFGKFSTHNHSTLDYPKLRLILQRGRSRVWLDHHAHHAYYDVQQGVPKRDNHSSLAYSCCHNCFTHYYGQHSSRRYCHPWSKITLFC